MLKGIETVVYYVDDLKAATRWYAETLGIKPNTPYYVGFTVAGDELGLHPVGDDPRRPGTWEQTAYWTVADIEKAVAHFVDRGAKVYHEITDVGDGIKIASVLDPFGNVFGFIENSGSLNLES